MNINLLCYVAFIGMLAVPINAAGISQKGGIMLENSQTVFLAALEIQMSLCPCPSQCLLLLHSRFDLRLDLHPGHRLPRPDF